MEQSLSFYFNFLSARVPLFKFNLQNEARGKTSCLVFFLSFHFKTIFQNLKETFKERNFHCEKV